MHAEERHGPLGGNARSARGARGDLELQRRYLETVVELSRREAASRMMYLAESYAAWRLAQLAPRRWRSDAVRSVPVNLYWNRNESRKRESWTALDSGG